jgi:hypothetical protein
LPLATGFRFKQFVDIHGVNNEVVQLKKRFADAVTCLGIEVSRATSFRTLDLCSRLSDVNVPLFHYCCTSTNVWVEMLIVDTRRSRQAGIIYPLFHHVQALQDST